MPEPKVEMLESQKMQLGESVGWPTASAGPYICAALWSCTISCSLSQEQVIHQPTRSGTSNLSLPLILLSPPTNFRPGLWKDQRVPFCCETTLWPAKTSDLVFHCWSYGEEIYMSKPPSFCIWLSHHLSSSYKEKEKTAHSICAGDPRKKQPLSTTNTQGASI